MNQIVSRMKEDVVRVHQIDARVKHFVSLMRHFVSLVHQRDARVKHFVSCLNYMLLQHLKRKAFQAIR